MRARRVATFAPEQHVERFGEGAQLKRSGLIEFARMCGLDPSKHAEEIAEYFELHKDATRKFMETTFGRDKTKITVRGVDDLIIIDEAHTLLPHQRLTLLDARRARPLLGANIVTDMQYGAEESVRITRGVWK